MITAYPLAIINSYKTNKDYYKVSSVRSVSGSPGKSRQFLNLPYDQTAYKQLVKQAAQDTADLVRSADDAKQSAKAWLQASSRFAPDSSEDTNELIKPLRQFVSSFNKLQENLNQSGGQVNLTLAKGIDQAAKLYLAQGPGISPDENGALQLHEDEFKKLVADGLSDIKKRLKGVSNFASLLGSTMDSLEQLPSEGLFQVENSPLQTYTQYRRQKGYLPVPMKGLLLDTRM
ncbi:hypothetical protein [Paenibacillus hexagrammi]|uniref:Uncharacterized protein n=1 Tax=Paenibacillus hexagrammi TaxID=2908839 RepID=A0ABY3SEU0_9BACL|nr:hypothetical protein [Paenibacillus sp. YPD9-1]UJF32411.1 hypothetical protein L0M14_22360 [Paenibacillus sp. YPD9-1]